MATFYSTAYKVHHNSNRLGIRLDGPKPKFARADGGEGGSHPSNVHDHVYAIGARARGGCVGVECVWMRRGLHAPNPPPACLPACTRAPPPPTHTLQLHTRQ